MSVRGGHIAVDLTRSVRTMMAATPALTGVLPATLAPRMLPVWVSVLY